MCDRNILLNLRGKFYRTAIKPTLLYGTEYWANKKQHIQKMSVAKMRILKLCGKTRKDKVRNKNIRLQVGIAAIEEKLKETRLQWFGHIECREGGDKNDINY